MQSTDAREDVLIHTRDIPLDTRGILASEIITERSHWVGDCLIWTGRSDRDGYGIISLRGHNYLVHRVSYTIAHGRIPAGLTIDHLCRNEACQNVEHMEAVTAQENARRRGRGTDTHCTNGHLWADDNLRPYMRRSGRVDRQCRSCRKEIQARGRRAV